MLHEVDKTNTRSQQRCSRLSWLNLLIASFQLYAIFNFVLSCCTWTETCSARMLHCSAASILIFAFVGCLNARVSTGQTKIFFEFALMIWVQNTCIGSIIKVQHVFFFLPSKYYVFQIFWSCHCLNSHPWGAFKSTCSYDTLKKPFAMLNVAARNRKILSHNFPETNWRSPLIPLQLL